MSFSTQMEMMQALMEGKRLTKAHFEDEEYIHLVNGEVRDEKGEPYSLELNEYEDCFFWSETTDKKTVKFLEYFNPDGTIHFRWVRSDAPVSSEWKVTGNVRTIKYTDTKVLEDDEDYVFESEDEDNDSIPF